MKVLIGGFDLFGAVGGGQTYYRNVILRNPQIEFHYFRQNESVHHSRPANARTIDYRIWYDPSCFVHPFDHGVPPWALSPYLDAHNLARCVSGHCYDVIDIPDYYNFGLFLRPALRHHDVKAGRIAMSMHGAISTSLSLNWGSDGSIDLPIRQIELMQYSAADLRYFISAYYRDEWQGYSPLETHLLDPMWFFDVPKPLPYRPETERPILRFIGRVEKRKGPHLFVEMAWWLPCGSYDSAEIIGPDCPGVQGQSAVAELETMCRRRGLNIRILKAQSMDELARGFASRSIVFAPSIYDTLNLVALEALFSGCPTVVGQNAGICRFLRERFPSIPFVPFDTDHFLANLPRVSELLDQYDERRTALEQAIKQADTSPVGPRLADIYDSRPVHDSAVSELTESWHQSLAHLLPDAVPTRKLAVAA
jgi:glycosyltransferase involved in cell wall biosynthesis